MSFFEKIKSALNKTRDHLVSALGTLQENPIAPENAWDEIRQALIQADIGSEQTDRILSKVRVQATQAGVLSVPDIIVILKRSLKEMFRPYVPPGPHPGPHIILMVGVNGCGKTTSSAKLAYRMSREGKKVLMIAGDTFRAAGSSQLSIWGDKMGVSVFGLEQGHSPSSVVYEGLKKAYAVPVDSVVIDTAGRVQTKEVLMEELKKLRKVIAKYDGTAPHETFLVLDSTVGQNALLQAKAFHEASELTGVILTKLDGSAKGGMAFAVSGSLNLPIAKVGVGEGPEDMIDFDPEQFVEAFFAV